VKQPRQAPNFAPLPPRDPSKGPVVVGLDKSNPNKATFALPQTPMHGFSPDESMTAHTPFSPETVSKWKAQTGVAPPDPDLQTAIDKLKGFGSKDPYSGAQIGPNVDIPGGMSLSQSAARRLMGEMQPGHVPGPNLLKDPEFMRLWGPKNTQMPPQAAFPPNPSDAWKDDFFQHLKKVNEQSHEDMVLHDWAKKHGFGGMSLSELKDLGIGPELVKAQAAKGPTILPKITINEPNPENWSTAQHEAFMKKFPKKGEPQPDFDEMFKDKDSLLKWLHEGNPDQ
jgi:hypothetical protein